MSVKIYLTICCSKNKKIGLGFIFLRLPLNTPLPIDTKYIIILRMTKY